MMTREKIEAMVYIPGCSAKNEARINMLRNTALAAMDERDSLRTAIRKALAYQTPIGGSFD